MILAIDNERLSAEHLALLILLIDQIEFEEGREVKVLEKVLVAFLMQVWRLRYWIFEKTFTCYNFAEIQLYWLRNG